ncbi:hypothetical protein [Streptosporangium sandarakinum]|uniref:hypothetical protein n=1 Tax=Streptosporangium sandarakinum TaxID=1260955 RepID=UPI0033A97E78
MGLSERLLRYAAGRPRPLLAGVPHGTRVRLLAEAELARRGWPAARSPAEADLLVVCGSPGVALAEAVEVVWADTPAPRARADLPGDLSPERVAAALDGAARHLADGRAQRLDAARRTGRPGGGHGQDGDHGDGAEGPGGLEMAGRGPDRDGLALDRLRLPLGPVLPDWPAGLLVETVAQGDVVQEARVEVLGGAGEERFWDEPWLEAARGRSVTRDEAARRTAAAHLDSLGRLLAVAGWDAEASRARRLRDRLLWERAGGEITGDVTRFTRRVRRSRTLRWMLRGLGTIGPAPGRDGRARGGTPDGPGTAGSGSAPRGPGTVGDAPGPAGPDRGDVLGRLEGWLARTEAALRDLGDGTRLTGDEGPRGPVGGRPPAASPSAPPVPPVFSVAAVLSTLPGLLAGAELAAARLIVASLDPDLDQAPSSWEAARA